MKKILSGFKYTLLLLFALVNNACEKVINPFVADIETFTIADYLEQNEREYSYFLQLAKEGELMEALGSYNPHGNDYTLFLPRNSAFEKFFARSGDYNNIRDLLNDVEFTKLLGRYHVLNRGVSSFDFPIGALPSETLSGDILTVGTRSGLDSSLYLINNVAPVSVRNISTSNGYIHVLNEVLEPVAVSGYEWLKNNPDYSTLTEIFELTGMKDRMGLTTTSSGLTVKNNYTILATGDSIFSREGIHSVQDLIQKVSPNNSDYTSELNPLYQFAAYQILEGIYFLDGFSDKSTNLNTFGLLPINIIAGARIRINNDPNHKFGIVVRGNDTTYINFVEPLYDHSNILTMNGAIHFLNNVLYVYRPRLETVRFNFREDQIISELFKVRIPHVLTRETPFNLISWTGPPEMLYVRGSGENDHLEIEGDFTLSYQTPRILPGRYRVIIRANSNYAGNAIVEILIDGRKLGANLMLTTGGAFTDHTIGTVDFSNYLSRLITVRNVSPGRFTWDYIEFVPI